MLPLKNLARKELSYSTAEWLHTTEENYSAITYSYSTPR